MAALGTTYKPREIEATMATGSTDMGNVSVSAEATYSL
jgi:hypothetical protein